MGDDLYRDFEGEARKRLGARDPEDWPILAAALALGCPIWTEDTDFFWTWRRHADVRQHRHLSSAVSPPPIRLLRSGVHSSVVNYGSGIRTSEETSYTVAIIIVAPLAADLDRATLRLTA